MPFFIHMLRRAVPPVVFIALITTASAMERPPGPGDVRITVEQLDGGLLRVSYDLNKPQRAVGFDRVAGNYRKRRWTFDAAGYQLIQDGVGERIERSDGARFDHVVITAAPDIIRLPKEYQPIARYGDGGAMVYTGHFWPMTGRGGRVNATFSFLPAPDAKVVAFGERVEALEDWRSPLAHPAFVYMGPLTPVETAEVMAVVDPKAPQWIIDDFYELTPRIFAQLAETFGFALETKPNLFLAAPLGRDKGRISYAGDALPGQFQITLQGAGWLAETDQTREIFRRSTIHEAVHLWQSAAARPSIEETAAWIHEGGADAVAAELMVAFGYWDVAEAGEFHLEAKADCAVGLEDGSLASAGDRAAYRALYACGFIIASAVEMADGSPPSAFWRDFMASAKSHGEYSEEFFFDFVEARTGNQEFAKALRYFVRTPLADPDREIGRLMAAAGLPLAPSLAR